MRVLEAHEKAQKKLYRALQKELRHLDQAKDRYLRSYERIYKRSLRVPIKTSQRKSLLSAAAKSQVVLVGDFHPFRQSQKGFIRLLKDTRGLSVTPAAIALECIQIRFQPFLDHFANGKITIQELKEEVEFEHHWPFAWENYVEIFLYARAEGIPLLAANIDPPAGSRFALQLRDKAAAKIISKFSEEFPGAQVFCLYGEMHLAAPHLPALLRREAKGRVLVVHQNEPYLYWAAPRNSGGERPEVLRLGASEFCVLNSVPWIKLRSYLDWAEGSANDDWEEDTDITGAVIHFSSMLAELLKLDSAASDATEIHGELEMREPPRKGTAALERALHKHSRELHRVSALTASRVLLVPSVSTNALTEAGAIYLWIKNNHGRHPPTLGPRLLVQFMAGYLGSKLLNPKRKCNEEDDMHRFLSAAKGNRDPKALVFARALAILAPILHAKKNKSRKLATTQEIEAIRLAGYVLGNRLFHCWGRKKSSTSLVSAIFTSSVSTEAWAYHLLSKVKRELDQPRRLPPAKHERF